MVKWHRMTATALLVLLPLTGVPSVEAAGHHGHGGHRVTPHRAAPHRAMHRPVRRPIVRHVARPRIVRPTPRRLAPTLLQRRPLKNPSTHSFARPRARRVVTGLPSRPVDARRLRDMQPLADPSPQGNLPLANPTEEPTQTSPCPEAQPADRQSKDPPATLPRWATDLLAWSPPSECHNFTYRMSTGNEPTKEVGNGTITTLLGVKPGVTIDSSHTVDIQALPDGQILGVRDGKGYSHTAIVLRGADGVNHIYQYLQSSNIAEQHGWNGKGKGNSGRYAQFDTFAQFRDQAERNPNTGQTRQPYANSSIELLTPGGRLETPDGRPMSVNVKLHAKTQMNAR